MWFGCAIDVGVASATALHSALSRSIRVPNQLDSTVAPPHLPTPLSRRCPHLSVSCLLCMCVCVCPPSPFLVFPLSCLLTALWRRLKANDYKREADQQQEFKQPTRGEKREKRKNVCGTFNRGGVRATGARRMESTREGEWRCGRVGGG